ncbi:MAG: M56 family metallopeptidase [Pseudomonadota bacterium]
MIVGEALLDAFINANILIVVAFVLWLGLRNLMERTAFRYAYDVQLGLLNAVFVAILCAPFLAAGVQALRGVGLAELLDVNLSDMVVSYYLNGGLEMKASEFEKLIMARDTLTLNILTAEGVFAQAVITAFLAGLALGVTRLAYSIFCLWRIVANSYSWRSFGRLRLRVSDHTLVPFSTRGWRNYYVVVPSHMLGQADEMKVALAHELQHIRGGDLEWEVLLEALKPLFFFNPAYHAWKRQVEHLRELTCDRAVISHGRIEMRTYCETLLSICQQTLRRDRAFVIAVPKVTLVTADRSSAAIGKPSLLEYRVLSLLNGAQIRRRKLLFAVLAIPLMICVAVTTLAIQRPADWSQDRLMLSTVVNLDRLNEINRLSTFGRIRN